MNQPFQPPPPARRRKAAAVIAALALALLALLSTSGSANFPILHYLPVHTALESLAVVLSAIAFVFLWQAPAQALRVGIVCLGASLAASAVLDFLHAMSYQGMPDLVTHSGPEKAIGFWLAGRLAMLSGMAAVAWLPYDRRVNAPQRLAILCGALGCATAGSYGLLFHADALPRTYLPGTGLTTTKVAAELGLVALLAVVAWRLQRLARRRHDVAVHSLAKAAAIAALGELCFSSYATVTDVINLTGHLCKLGAYLFIARSAYQVAIAQPLRASGSLATALTATSNTALLTDGQGIIQWANPSFYRRTGWSQADLIGRRLADACQPLEDPATARCFQLALAEAREFIGDVLVRRRDGTRYLDRRTLTPIRLEGGYLSGFVMLGEDITEQQAQQRRQAQSQKLEALGQLTGGIAHDFNNVLAAIMGQAHLGLKSPELDPRGPLAGHLRGVLRSSERGRDLVRKLMAFARTAEAPAAADPVRMDLVVDDVLDMLKSSIPSDVKVQYDITPDLPPVALSSVDIQQVVMNLVLNARDAVGTGGHLIVGLEQVQLNDAPCTCCGKRATGPHLRFRVEDDGPGIPEDVLPRIFDPFFTTKEAGKGTGLGLSTVLGIVHGAGGHITIEARRPRGTTVAVLLPVASALPHGVAPTSVAPAAPQRGTVWVVDDDPILRLFLNEALSQGGYEVRSFDHPQAVLEAVAHTLTPPDALVSDEQMPEMSGTTLIQQIRPGWPATRFVLCTGSADDLQGAAGVDVVLAKPTPVEVLLQALQRSDRPLDGGAPGLEPEGPRG